MPRIAILGTLDSKGSEHAWVRDEIQRRGHQTLMIDVGSGGPPTVAPDISREELATRTGLDLPPLLARQDRGECVTAMAKAAASLVAQLAADGEISGIISLGGGGGTAIASAAMRALPIGFPKLLVSTLASGNTAPYIAEKDIVMMPSIVDVAGLNRLSRLLFAQAAGAICGMVDTKLDISAERPLIVASMFGNSTACVNEAKRQLELVGYEVLVFAATGNGGRAMEAMIASGMVAGVLDLTTTEWADELVGGVLAAGKTRMDAAAQAGVPVVIAPGCMDMVNFGSLETVPTQFKDRRFYQHNPQVTLMRTTHQENAELGSILAAKANACRGHVRIFLPLRGLSQIGAEGQPFHDQAADDALFEALTRDSNVPVTALDCAINHPDFASACVAGLLDLIGNHGKLP